MEKLSRTRHLLTTFRGHTLRQTLVQLVRRERLGSSIVLASKEEIQEEVAQTFDSYFNYSSRAERDGTISESIICGLNSKCTGRDPDLLERFNFGFAI